MSVIGTKDFEKNSDSHPVSRNPFGKPVSENGYIVIHDSNKLTGNQESKRNGIGVDVRSSLTWALTDALVDWSGFVHSRKMIEEDFLSSAVIAYLSYCWLFASAVIEEGGKRKCELVFVFMLKLMSEQGES
ncbi:hypothetical protein STEG23_035789 [Scotinomys teguina]